MRERKFDGPFPESWLAILRDNVLLYRLLTEEEQARVCHAVRVLSAEKRWEGCRGLVMTDEIGVTIAGQAAIMLLGFDNYYFDELQTILVYPGGFLAESHDPLDEDDEPRRAMGQAFPGGPVILSWWDARWGGKRLDGTNVVIHEFAHKLGEMGNAAAGRPPLDNRELERRWEEVMGPEFEQLNEDAAYGRPTLIDPYGAESRCEFFAVTSECFFTQPVKLRRRHPALYDLLASFYRQDPTSRPITEAVVVSAKEADQEYARHVVAECTVALKHRPDFLDAYRDRAMWYCELEEYDKALADCSELIQRARDEEERADAYHERGCVQREAGNLDEALEDFDEAIRLLPDFELALCTRGSLRAERGELKTALADLRAALRLDPNDDSALIERGLVYREMGELDKALRDLTKAIRLCPHAPDVLMHRARVYLHRGDREQALADCEEALRIDPENEEALKVREEACQ